MTPTTSASRRLLERLREDRRYWAERAHEDEASTFSRLAATSRRDLLDSLLTRLPDELAAIEDEAFVDDSRLVRWLEDGAGIPVGCE